MSSGKRIEKTLFWIEYRLFLRSLRAIVLCDGLFDGEIRHTAGVYFRTAYNMQREITFSKKMTGCEEYCFTDSYIKDLDKLRRTKIVTSFISIFTKKHGKKAIPKNLKSQSKKVVLGDMLNDDEEELEGEEEEIETEYVSPNGEALLKICASPMIKSPALTEISENVFDVKLRKVVVSEHMINEFLILAQQHIARKIEFCGMLVGLEVGGDKPGESYFMVTHCLIPDQAGCDDFVVCDDEYHMLQYQSMNGLITLGWIHTHPTQSAFLSSMDIYTQFGFQRMLDEFIAIVCAPRKKQNIGVFRIISTKMEKVRQLTVSNKKFGKSLIKFGEKMYEDCEHCVINEAMEGQVVDLRTNKKVRILK